jgi:hypothetical protein
MSLKKTPMNWQTCIRTLSKLLNENNDDIEAMLQLLSTVLIIPENDSDIVRLAHLSFREYAISKHAGQINLHLDSTICRDPFLMAL